jgi:hypothetical protein
MQKRGVFGYPPLKVCFWMFEGVILAFECVQMPAFEGMSSDARL